jgi:hypothetical protein
MAGSSILTRRTFLGAAAATLTASDVFAAPDAPIARIDYKAFLPELAENDALRRTWWARFRKAEPYASTCLGSWEYGGLNTVKMTSDKTTWGPDGTLNMTRESLEKGAIFHEMFHPILHNAPFKLKAEKNHPDYRLYVECLCNTFQYFMEVNAGLRGDWVTRIAKWRNKNWAQIIAESTSISYDMTYGLPTLEFIKACSGFDQFKKLIANLNAKS